MVSMSKRLRTGQRAIAYDIVVDYEGILIDDSLLERSSSQ